MTFRVGLGSATLRPFGEAIDDAPAPLKSWALPADSPYVDANKMGALTILDTE